MAGSSALVAAAGDLEALRQRTARHAVEAVTRNDVAPDRLRRELTDVGLEAGVDPDHFLFAVFSRVGTSPALRRVAPRVAANVVVQVLAACGGFPSAGLWLNEADGTLGPVASVGGSEAIDEGLAAAVIAGTEPPVPPSRAVPVIRFGRRAGALVAGRSPDPLRSEAFLAEAAGMLTGLLERDLQLERNAERERTIAGALERRLTRFAYDLHDGPLQDLAALGADVALLRRQLASVVPAADGARVDGRFEDIQARLDALDRALRGLLESARGGIGDGVSLERRIAHEVALFRASTGIPASLTLEGRFDDLTESRRLAVFRIVQEALANAAEHSFASSVTVRVAEDAGRVEVSVEDDGCGFDLAEALLHAGRHGRFGLAGMRERVRLLGGDLDVRSRRGGGTCVSFSLDPWRPIRDAAGEASSEVAL